MKIEDWLAQATKKLKLSDIPTARLDALLLLEATTQKDRSWILAHPEKIIDGVALKLLNQQILRRSKHEPLAYIRGKSEFYGREFIVNKNTLEPRPETETMIDLLKELVDSKQLTVNSSIVVDVGTGSGCLAITTKLLLPYVEVYGTDIDKNCIQTANKNAEKHGVSINLFQGNLLEPIDTKTSIAQEIVLANLPYVPDSHTINKAAMFEPKSAIFGGPDGLDLYRDLFAQINKVSNKPVFVFTESLPFQHEELAKITKNAGYKQIQQEDFIQVFTAE